MLAAYGRSWSSPRRWGCRARWRRRRSLPAHSRQLHPRTVRQPCQPDAHYRTTGPEIWADTQGKVDVLVACVGTGGTLSGTARYLKEQNPAIHVAAVERRLPDSPAARLAPHQIQGIGANFIPTPWTGASTIRSSGSGRGRIYCRTGVGPHRGCSGGDLPPARLCGPPPNWPDSRNTRVRPSWSSSPTPATAISSPMFAE